MGHNHSKSKYPLQIPLAGQLFFEKKILTSTTHHLMKHLSSNGSTISLAALKATSDISKVITCDNLCSSSEFDIAIVNNKCQTSSVIDRKKITKYLFTENLQSIFSLTFSEDFSIGVIENNQNFGHNYLHRYSGFHNNIIYYIVTIKFEPVCDMVDPFWILIVQNIKHDIVREKIINNNKIIIQPNIDLKPIYDEPLPPNILENIDKFASELQTNEKWYIINYNNNPHCLKKYSDKCLKVFDI